MWTAEAINKDRVLRQHSTRLLPRLASPGLARDDALGSVKLEASAVCTRAHRASRERPDMARGKPVGLFIRQAAPADDVQKSDDNNASSQQHVRARAVGRTCRLGNRNGLGMRGLTSASGKPIAAFFRAMGRDGGKMWMGECAFAFRRLSLLRWRSGWAELS